MRRWILGFALVALLVILYATFSHVRATRARQQREAVYQSVLRSYQAAVAPGTPREQVERYLESNAVHFERLCCTSSEYTASDIAKIGEEPSPWYCSRNLVYIEFQFSTGTNNYVQSDPSDRLKKIAFNQKVEGCL
jgi:hypothetical protein